VDSLLVIHEARLNNIKTDIAHASIAKAGHTARVGCAGSALAGVGAGDHLERNQRIWHRGACCREIEG